MSRYSFHVSNNRTINPDSPILNIRPDICPICKAQRIELFSFNGYPQKYSEAVNYMLQGYDVKFNQYEIRYMKCQHCNKEFVIDWSGGFPRPLRDTFKSDRFFQEFFSGF